MNYIKENQIEENSATAEPHEVHAQEDNAELEVDGEAPIRFQPEHVGVTKEMIDSPGVPVLPDGSVAVVMESAEKMPKADMFPECTGFPWRTTWDRTADGNWNLVEDEIRWEDLHQPERLLPQTADLVIVFRKRIDGRPDRHMQNFPGMRRVTLEKMVQTAHEGLGHPETQRFIRILRHGGAGNEVIEIAKKMRCSVCEAYKLPDAVRQGAPPREGLFINDLVGVDTIHLRSHLNQPIPALNMIDWHSHFQLVVPMTVENATEARRIYIINSRLHLWLPFWCL